MEGVFDGSVSRARHGRNLLKVYGTSVDRGEDRPSDEVVSSRGVVLLTDFCSSRTLDERRRLRYLEVFRGDLPLTNERRRTGFMAFRIGNRWWWWRSRPSSGRGMDLRTD